MKFIWKIKTLLLRIGSDREAKIVWKNVFRNYEDIKILWFLLNKNKVNSFVEYIKDNFPIISQVFVCRLFVLKILNCLIKKAI